MCVRYEWCCRHAQHPATPNPSRLSLNSKTCRALPLEVTSASDSHRLHIAGRLGIQRITTGINLS